VTRSLWLVCDRSGSIREEARRFIVRNLVRGVEQFVRLRSDSCHVVKLISWNDTVTVVDWAKDDEFPQFLLDCAGSVDASVLTALSEVSESDKILIITDGSWSGDTTNAIAAWRQQKNLSVRFIKIGSDSGARLVGPDVFSAEDLVSALEGWLDV
jgi:hypothetical protein